jgi:hypothetical protein
MKLSLVILALACTVATAQVPTYTWQVETAQRPAPFALELIRGESITLVPQYVSNSISFSLQGATNADFRYRSADMAADTFYSVSGVITGSSVRFAWEATNCVAATNYTYAIAVYGSGVNLRAYGTLKLIGVVSGTQITSGAAAIASRNLYVVTNANGSGCSITGFFSVVP